MRAADERWISWSRLLSWSHLLFCRTDIFSSANFNFNYAQGHLKSAWLLNIDLFSSPLCYNRLIAGMRIRELTAASLSLLLAFFIYVYQFLTAIIFTVSSHLHLLNSTNQRICRSWSNLKAEDGKSGRECIHIVANSSISLMLAYGVLHYHELFVELIILVTHHVHHWFIRLIADVPDLSNFIRSSYIIRLSLCHLYLIFGYLGISAQLVLTVDLIYLCNLPTIFLYKFLAKAYKFLLKYFGVMV